ncbi:Hydroxymethylpyrimidine/phosphomethylpyrimidine kinase [bacterium HR10]|nr:Hydroxymethylpyrimidine/phosphomethylpyrimidine kinase [bacterium HR10]
MVAKALTIAGSDSGGGAGIQADLKTFTALRVYGLSVLTAITAQDTCRVAGVIEVPADFVRLQLDVVMCDIGADAAKTGMLSSPEIIEAVAEGIREHRIERLVVDPVMRAKSGDRLLRAEAEEALVRRLLPLAYLVTPNIPEAEALVGWPIRSLEDMRNAARHIFELGPRAVLVKGGHLDSGSEAVDILYDGREFHEVVAERIPTRNTHGTGCTYSAAITAYLARGEGLLEAVRRAKHYVTMAIRYGFPIGRGHGPLNHFWREGEAE